MVMGSKVRAATRGWAIAPNRVYPWDTLPTHAPPNPYSSES
jgi:hypothetical protein